MINILRNYIRKALLQEGLAGFGNTLFLKEIIKQVEAGNITIQRVRDNRGDTDAIFERAVVFSFPVDAIQSIYEGASPELQDWIIKKFDNLEFFTRNFSRLKWAITSGYPNYPRALGLAGDASQRATILINKKTGEEVPYLSTEWNAYMKRTKGGDKKDPDYELHQHFGLPTDNAYRGSEYQESGYISVKTIGDQSVDSLMRHSRSEWPKMIAKYMKQAMNKPGKATWTHELQHWVQNLSYYSSRKNKRNSRNSTRIIEKPYGALGRTGIYLIGAKLDAKISNVRTEPPYTYADISGLTNEDIKVLKAKSVKSLINPRRDQLWPQKVIDHLWSRFENAGTKQKTKPIANAPTKQRYFTQWKTACVVKLFGKNWSTTGLEIKGITTEGKLVTVSSKWVSKIVSLRLNRTSSRQTPGVPLAGKDAIPRYEQKPYRSINFNRTTYNNRFSLDPNRMHSAWEHRIEELDAEKAANLKRVVDSLFTRSAAAYPHVIWSSLLKQDTQTAYEWLLELYKDEFQRFRDKRAHKMLRAEQKSIDKIAKKFTDYLQECVDRVDSVSYISPEEYRELESRSIKLFDKLRERGWLTAVKNEIYQN